MRTRESPPDQWGSKPGLEAGLPSSEARPLSHVARSSLRLPRSLCAVLQETQGGTGEVRRASQLQNRILRGASRSWLGGGAPWLLKYSQGHLPAGSPGIMCFISLSVKWAQSGHTTGVKTWENSGSVPSWCLVSPAFLLSAKVQTHRMIQRAQEKWGNWYTRRLVSPVLLKGSG